MEEIKDTCYKGTRILVGNEKRSIVNKMVEVLIKKSFTEIQIPAIQLRSTFVGKVGDENTNLMFNFQDRAERNLCLAPEYTAVVQLLANKRYKLERNVALFYVLECFRGEKPQAGRYRQFTQLGVELLNPTMNKPVDFMASIASQLLETCYDWNDFYLDSGVTRGLDYYKGGKGFEISCEKLGSSKQVCGGGLYEGGVGFAIGIDRLLMLNPNKHVG